MVIVWLWYACYKHNSIVLRFLLFSKHNNIHQWFCVFRFSGDISYSGYGLYIRINGQQSITCKQSDFEGWRSEWWAADIRKNEIIKRQGRSKVCRSAPIWRSSVSSDIGRVTNRKHRLQDSFSCFPDRLTWFDTTSRQLLLRRHWRCAVCVQCK